MAITKLHVRKRKRRGCFHSEDLVDRQERSVDCEDQANNRSLKGVKRDDREDLSLFRHSGTGVR